ncbi:MAG: DnaD domain protein [Candidatus Flemingiibacterium sp.]
MSAKLRLEWGDSILSLPREGLLAALPGAGGFDLKVLICAAAEDRLRSDPEELKSELCKRLDCTKSALEKSLSFWSDAGVITLDGTAAEAPADAEAKASPESGAGTKKHLQSGALPQYSESECADIIASSEELPNIIDMCQQLLGKIFTSADVEAIVALYDHLNLTPDYIGCLVKYCADNGKRSLRYIEKTALSLFDEGICTSEALDAYLKQKERLADDLSQIRRLTGSDGRELTTKEKKTFSRWLEEWKFGVDMIKRAWEITVDKIKEPNIDYINRVLENWHKSGLATIADVDASLEAYKKKKTEAAGGMQTVAGQPSGFQTDEIMEAILKRSYGG